MPRANDGVKRYVFGILRDDSLGEFRTNVGHFQRTGRFIHDFCRQAEKAKALFWNVFHQGQFYAAGFRRPQRLAARPLRRQVVAYLIRHEETYLTCFLEAAGIKSGIQEGLCVSIVNIRAACDEIRRKVEI